MANNDTANRDNITPLQVINRLMRRGQVSDRLGVSAVMEQLEISPIPLSAVVPMALSITINSVPDLERRRKRIPLSYIFLESYLLANKGSKKFAFLYKDLAQEQIAAQTDEEVEGAED